MEPHLQPQEKALPGQSEFWGITADDPGMSFLFLHWFVPVREPRWQVVCRTQIQILRSIFVIP
jgi:hypothetical protein